MDTWSSDESSPEPIGDKDCPICKGGGFVHPRLPSGKPDYRRVVACRCVKRAREKEKEGRLQKYSNLGVLSKYDFDALAASGFSGLSVNQDLFNKAFEAARVFASNPEGWLILAGPSGSGKTFLAAAIANERIKQDIRLFFRPFRSFWTICARPSRRIAKSLTMSFSSRSATRRC
jgi:DNA replication protein DnaC